MKKILSFLLSLVLVSSLLLSDAGIIVNANAAKKRTSLGQTYISLDGERYQTKAYIDANEDIFVSVSAIETLLGIKAKSKFKVSGKPYGNLTKACADAGMESFEYDEVLNYVYIWSENFEDEFSSDADLTRIKYYKLGTPKDKKITFKSFFGILDKAVKRAAPKKLSEWKSLSEFKALRSSKKAVTRIDAAMIIQRMAALLGNEYCDFNHDLGLVTPKWGNAMGEIESAQKKCRVKNVSPYNYGGFETSEWIYDQNWDWRLLSAHFVIGRKSIYSGNTLFDLDEENKSMHFDKYITSKETMLAAVRLLDSVEKAKSTFMKKSTDPSVRSYNEKIITPEIVKFASNLPDVSDENIPDWKGLIWVEAVENGSLQADTVTDLIKMWSQWGFNSVRYYIPYTMLFSLDGSKVNEAELNRLDRIVAAAMKNKIHIELVFSGLPGMNQDLSESQFIMGGQFDLFNNPEKQKQARLVWETLAERYAALPNSMLSFNLLQEILPGTDVNLLYDDDIAKVYMDLIDGIRKYDPDRFIVFEDPTYENNSQRTEIVTRVICNKYDNVQVAYNYGDQPFIYYHMTVEEGEHLDNCPRSMFEAEYPRKYYSLNWYLNPDAPLIMTGELPAGTTIDFGIWQIYTENADIIIKADGKTIYSEHISQPEGFSEYKVSAALSGRLPYRDSEKTVSVTLEKDAEKVEIIIDGGEWDCINWSGMIVTLPEKYAVERMFRPSVYEFFLENGRMPEGDEWSQLYPHLKKTSEIIIAPYLEDDHTPSNHIIINPDVTYATDSIYHESNIDTISEWIRKVQSKDLGKVIMRYENACFSGNYYSCIRYYDDLLKSCKKYKLDWYTNDFSFNDYVYVPDYKSYALEGIWPDSKNVKYGDGWLRIDMMNVYLKYLDVTKIK